MENNIVVTQDMIDSFTAAMREAYRAYGDDEEYVHGVMDDIMCETLDRLGIIIMDLSFFDFGLKPPCGYIKAKHIRPAYGKGTRPVKAHKRIMRTREGFRK